jgi:hypothetical protein
MARQKASNTKLGMQVFKMPKANQGGFKASLV